MIENAVEKRSCETDVHLFTTMKYQHFSFQLKSGYMHYKHYFLFLFLDDDNLLETKLATNNAQHVYYKHCSKLLCLMFTIINSCNNSLC